MKTHLLREGKKPQFIVLEAGDITLTGKDIASLSRVLGKISPFADPNDNTSEEDKIWLSIITGLLDIEQPPSIREALAENHSLPGWFLEKLSLLEPLTSEMVIGLCKNTSTPPRILERMLEPSGRGGVAPSYASGDFPNGREIENLILTNPGTPPDVLFNAFKDFDNWPSLASNTALEREYFEEMLDNWGYLEPNQQFSMFMNLASNTALPPDLMEKLFQTNDAILYPEARAVIRGFIASNPSTPEHVLRELMLAGKASVHDKLMTNPSTPHDILEELLERYDVEKWSRIMANPSLSPELIEQIYNKHKSNDYILLYIAGNPRTPPHILEGIYNTIGRLPIRVLSPRLESALEQIASNPSTPTIILYFIVQKGDFDSLPIWKVASNPSTPLNLLINLYSTEHPNFKEALARNTRGFSDT